MRIYYPSAEKSADSMRRDRHAKIAAYILSKGVELHARPSKLEARGLQWLNDTDGVIVERERFTQQLERECLHADQLGKEILILLQRDPARLRQRQDPTSALLDLTISETRPDARIRVVRSSPPVRPVPELALVKRAIDVFLVGRLDLRGSFAHPQHYDGVFDRVTMESVPPLDPQAEGVFEAEFAADLERSY